MESTTREGGGMDSVLLFLVACVVYWWSNW